MKCEACERDDHPNCGMQTWCECDCAGPDAIGMPDPQDAYFGHATFTTGEIDPETGFPKMRHEPLTKEAAEALWKAAEDAKKHRAEAMPTEQDALKAMFEGWVRLKELGWREAMYCPKDGSMFKAIEAGSTGIFDCNYRGKWPSGSFDVYEAGDVWPSHPILFKLLPEAQAEYDARMAKARAEYQQKSDKP